jgi:hypothetical protein
MTAPTYVTREEFEARVGTLEREVDGEKLVSRYILDQTRKNGDDIASMKSQLGRVETRLDGVETRLDGVEKRLDRVEHKIDGLARNMPGIVADAIREVDRERREREDGDGK